MATFQPGKGIWIVYEFRFDVVWANFDYLFNGIWLTLFISFSSLALGTFIGLIVCLLRLSARRVLSLPMVAYIEFFRNTPSIVKLVWVFYMVPIVLGFETSAIMSCIIAMSVSAGAYLAEVFRAGIQDVNRGDIEAAQSVGLSPAQTMRLIVLPQALRKVLLPTANTFIVFLKDSSLVSVIGIHDLMYRANVIATTTFRPLEVFTVLAVFYFAICFGLSSGIAMLERRIAVRQ